MLGLSRLKVIFNFWTRVTYLIGTLKIKYRDMYPSKHTESYDNE